MVLPSRAGFHGLLAVADESVDPLRVGAQGNSMTHDQSRPLVGEGDEPIDEFVDEFVDERVEESWAKSPPAADELAGVFGRLLDPTRDSDPLAEGDVIQEVYQEIHRMARRRPKEDLRPFLQTTDLANEVFLRFLQNGKIEYRDREHFLAIAARALRQLVVDHARSRKRYKRSAPGERVPIEEIRVKFEEKGMDIVLLDEELTLFEKIDPQAARVVELRFFGDYTMKETARILNVSMRTVERDWTVARAWLRGRLG